MGGSLVYAVTYTRPDLYFVVVKLSQNWSNPRPSDLLLVKHVFQYVKKTLNYSFVFHKTESLKLVAYSDADWASSHDNRSRITGYCYQNSVKYWLSEFGQTKFVKQIQFYQLVKLNAWKFCKHAKSFHS